MPTAARDPRSAVPLLLLLLSQLLLACGGAPKPVGFCADFSASQDLNFYDGQAHVVVVYLYPLRSQVDFQRLTPDELLAGAEAPAIDAPRQLTVAPGQSMPFQETLPPMTSHVGVLADYYVRPGEGEGNRKTVLPADCGRFGRSTVLLTAREVKVR